MTSPSKSADDDNDSWKPQANAAETGSSKLPASDPDETTYKIPGGLSGWIPGEIPPPNSDGTLKPGQSRVVRKVGPRTEPTVEAPTSRKRRGQQVHPTLALLGLNLLVFLSSVCVMTLELTASRLIAKHVGSSLYTWTSVIGVVLAGITLGNSLGGWLADRWPRAKVLAWMFLLASIACASVLWLDEMVAGMARPDYFSWPNWVLCVVATMFFIPAVLLGTTSPIVASMALERSTRTGSTVGNVYAWGAFGSIVGTFLTGFYLIDVWGTRAIIGLTAGTLAALAVAVAGGQWTFRTAVIAGWAQMLAFLWMLTTITSTTGAAVASSGMSTLTFGTANESSLSSWSRYGNTLGDRLHELGILLHLRSDERNAYHDESSYSYIQVRDDFIDGSPVRALRLDKLDHSYFDPAEPTALHYEYEQIYAAITKLATPRSSTELTASIPAFEGRDELMTRLPQGATFDATSGMLSVTSQDPVLMESLKRISLESAYWQAVRELQTETNHANWGGYSSVTLDELPSGITFPKSFDQRVHYDPNLKVLSAYEALTPDDVSQLLQLGPQSAWLSAVQQLSKPSLPLNTFFIGGGGFIFPRWILAEYPASNRIDIAELDPAVYQAVRREMGLTDAEDARLHTMIGDARNTVDDLLQANLRAQSKQQPVLHYDFIYGDAFNDFSVPWHLTTREFTQKVHDLLTPRGVFLANIIEIYPRTVIPGGTAVESTTPLGMTPPEAMFQPAQPGVERTVKSEFGSLSLVGGTTLRYVGEMPVGVEKQLLNLLPDNDQWNRVITGLATRTREWQPITTTLPSQLIPEALIDDDWTACPAPFAAVQINRLREGEYLLGLRGIPSDELREQLLALKAGDRQWQVLIDSSVERARQQAAGRFLGRYVNTMTTVFPYVAIFCTSQSDPSDSRDTFVVCCARTPLDASQLESFGNWEIRPFAEFVRTTAEGTPELRGQMGSVLELAEGQILTDDFAPVDNLLRPVFLDQD